MENNKCTSKQAKYLKDLCRKQGIAMDDTRIRGLTWKGADALIKQLRESPDASNEDKVETTRSKIDSIRFGLSSKLVYSRFNAKDMNPMERRKEFIDEVAETYLLLQTAESRVVQQA